jgi:hypothetical protein
LGKTEKVAKSGFKILANKAKMKSLKQRPNLFREGRMPSLE